MECYTNPNELHYVKLTDLDADFNEVYYENLA